MKRAYRWLLRGARLVAPLAAFGDGKLARSLRLRSEGAQAIGTWARELRDPRRRTVWFHGASVGELLQARAVADAMRAIRPELQVVYTYFSPSAEPFLDALGGDAVGPLPWDLPRPMRRLVEVLSPDLLVFTQKEVWPTLTDAAAGFGCPTALVAATLRGDAGRLRWPARSVLRESMENLALVAAIAEEDARNLLSVGARSDAVHVTGDPGVDSALSRAEAFDRRATCLRPFDRQIPTVVAGSTWSEDEEVLLPALRAVRESATDLRVVIAPHEPTPDTVGGLLARLGSDGWRASTLAQVETDASGGFVEEGQAVVVDRVGVLAGLYSVADASYVGGGFGLHGLHSVLEPAAFGSPVLFGPEHRGSMAAGDLINAGAAAMVEDESTLATALERWLSDPCERSAAGAAARGYIQRQRGASARTARLLVVLLSGEGDSVQEVG